MRLLKFGGSSVADGERMRAAAGIVAAHQRETPVTVVVSAMAGVTDALLRAAWAALAGDFAWFDELSQVECRHRDIYRDLIGTVPANFNPAWAALMDDAARLGAQRMSPGSAEAESVAARFSGWGERLAVPLFAAALGAAGVQAQPFPEEPVLLETHADPIEPARPSVLATRGWLVPRLARLVMRGGVPVLPGYIARDAAGQVTTLGRNGSDYSAAVIAAALGAAAVYIYSDVAGFHTADPRVVPEAALIPAITYAEAAEVAWLGARVLHPRTLAPLAHWHIPLYLRSSVEPDAPGTDVVPAHGSGTDVTLSHLRFRASCTSAGAWVVAARAAPDATTGSVVEVSATLLGDRLRTLEDDEPLLEAVADELPHHMRDAVPVLADSPRQLRLRVSPGAADDAQRTVHTTLLRLACNSVRQDTSPPEVLLPLESEVV